MLKNAIFYRLTGSFTLNTNEIEEAIKPSAFSPCSGQQLSSIGFTTIHPDSELMVLESGGNFLINTRKETKIIPPSAVNELLSERVKRIEKESGCSIKTKEKRELRDEIIIDMIPKAFSKFSEINLLIIPSAGLIVINTPSFSHAEDTLNLLRNSLGSLLIIAPKTQKSPGSTITTCLQDGSTINIDKFILGNNCEMKDPSEEGGTARFKSDDLTSESVLSNINEGKLITNIELIWDEIYRFTLNNDLRIKGIKTTDQITERMDATNFENIEDRLRAEVYTHSTELSRLWLDITEALGGEIKPEIESKTDSN
jgi:recombination associated protein RdgC